MTLQDCTKEELIFVVKRLCFYSLSDNYYITRALQDVADKRQEKKYAESKRLSAYSAEKRQEFIDLLTPYDGKNIADIPYDVVVKADAAMKAARAADAKWNKLMGIHIEKPKKKEG